MASSKGFTLIEIIITMGVVAAILAIAIPNFTNAIDNSKVQAVENNLRAIAAGEQKYYEDHGIYCPAALCANFGAINLNLSLTLASQNDGFNYSCTSLGTCTANNPTSTTGTINNVSINISGALSCGNSSSSSSNDNPGSGTVSSSSCP